MPRQHKRHIISRGRQPVAWAHLNNQHEKQLSQLQIQIMTRSLTRLKRRYFSRQSGLSMVKTELLTHMKRRLVVHGPPLQLSQSLQQRWPSMTISGWNQLWWSGTRRVNCRPQAMPQILTARPVPTSSNHVTQSILALMTASHTFKSSRCPRACYRSLCSWSITLS